LVVQPSAVSMPRPSVQAAGTDGTGRTSRKVALQVRATASAPSTCRRSSGSASTCIMVVSAQPVAPSFRDGRGDRLALRLQQVDLERPGAGGDDAFVLEVVDLDEGVVPVAADQLRWPRSRSSAALYWSSFSS
jgi:hypothetical protein